LSKVTVLVLVLAFLVVGAVNADWTMDSVLTGQLGTVGVHAVVTQTGSTYLYNYDVTATSVSTAVSLFDVGNVEQLDFTNATNVGATHAFTNPTYLPFLTSVTWVDGELDNTKTATFSYKSDYAPIQVETSVSGAGLSANGSTLGMTSVPEPSTVSLFGMGALGVLGLIRRRK
jgi:hypothetical protein